LWASHPLFSEAKDLLTKKSAAGVEEGREVSVKVAETKALLKSFMVRLDRLKIDSGLLFGSGLQDLTESFSGTEEIQALQREEMRPFLLMPGRIAVPGAVQESPLLKIMIQDKDGFREKIQQQLGTFQFRLTDDPKSADFVVGDWGFIQAQRQLAQDSTVLLEVTPSTVEQITSRFLTMIASQRNQLQPRAVIVMGTQDERTGAIPLAESA
jgi:hypothetical protein